MSGLPSVSALVDAMIAPELLNGVPALAELTASAREGLARVAREVEFRAGERIVPLIKPPQRVLFILDGLVKLVGVSMNEVEQDHLRLPPG
jgi:hypothetical protein